MFCQLYASDKEFFGNGIETYVKIYKVDTSKPNWYKTVCSAVSRLLRSVKVSQRINEILEMRGLNDGFVDKQLEFLISQHADFKSKLGAIKEYNQLKTRIKKKIDKIDDDGHVTEYENLSDEELDNEIQKRQNRVS